MKERKKRGLALLVLTSALLLGACGKNDKPARSSSSSTNPTHASSSVPLVTHSVVLPTGDGFEAKAAPGYSLTVKDGDSFKFEVTLKEGYTQGRGLSVKAGDATLSKGDDGYYTIANVKADVTVAIAVLINQYAITLPTGTGYSIQVAEGYTTTVDHGGDFKFSLTLAEGYTQGNGLIVKAGETALKKGEDGLYLIAGIQADVMVSIHVDLNTYTVALPTGTGYTAQAAEGYSTTVSHGADFKFSITLAEGYTQGNSLIVKAGETALEKGSDGLYAISNVTSDVNITASVAINTYTVSLPTGTGYSIQVAEGYTTTVSHGGDFKFSLTLAEGYTQGNGLTVKAGETTLEKGSDGLYAISNVTSDLTVSASVEINHYQVSLPTGTGYTAQAAEGYSTTVSHGADFKFSIALDAAYSQGRNLIVKVGEQTLTKGSDGLYTLSSVTSDVNITASVDINRYTVSFVSNGGSAVDSQSVEYNAVAAEPSAPSRTAEDGHTTYAFGGWKNEDGQAFSFDTPIASDTTLYADWKIGEAVKTRVVEVTSENVSVTAEGATVTKPSLGFNGATVSQTFTDDEGVVATSGTSAAGTISLPATDFNTLLQTYDQLTFTFGIYNSNNNVSWGDESTSLGENSDNDVTALKRFTCTIYKDPALGVAASIKDALANGNAAITTRALSQEHAAGTSSITLKQNLPGETRLWSIGHIYGIKGEKVLLSANEDGFISFPDGSTTKTMALNDSDFAWGSYASVLGIRRDLYHGIGVKGGVKASEPFTLKPIDFNAVFQSYDSVSFSMGLWNGNEQMTWGYGTNAVSLGQNQTVNGSDSTYDTCFENWTITIKRQWVEIYNHYENKTYYAHLSEAQRSGSEGVVIGTDPNKISENRFYFFSNVVANR